MAKRKLDSSKEGIPVAPNRRSSRRKRSNEDKSDVPTKTAASNGTTKTNTSKNRVIKEENVKTPLNAPPKQKVSNVLNGEIPKTQQYWLMKAEPESRLERGHDIKFSIDDLAVKTEPEPWDGIRAYPARNNLRAMKKGDLAFFYHSSCKVPAIVGIMEIVKEHSPDFSAQDPNAPYFDPKDLEVSNPRWSVVHVEFRRKFEEPITLKELRELSGKGGLLENMQMLKQSRLSVSRVTKDEWDFLMGIIERQEKQED